MRSVPRSQDTSPGDTSTITARKPTMHSEPLAAILRQQELKRDKSALGQRADLSGTNLSGAHLRGADLSGTNLSGTNLSGANLSEANLRGANLSGANLIGTNLSRADLNGANLIGTNLSRADLSGANLGHTILCGATIDGARLDPHDIGGPGHILYALTDEEAEWVKQHRA